MSNKYTIERDLSLGAVTSDMFSQTQRWTATDDKGDQHSVLTNKNDGPDEVGDEIARGNISPRR